MGHRLAIPEGMTRGSHVRAANDLHLRLLLQLLLFFRVYWVVNPRPTESAMEAVCIPSCSDVLQRQIMSVMNTRGGWWTLDPFSSCYLMQRAQSLARDSASVLSGMVHSTQRFFLAA